MWRKAELRLQKRSNFRYMSKGNAGDRSWISRGSVAFLLSVLFPCFIGVGVIALDVAPTSAISSQDEESSSSRPTETFCVDSQNLITLTTTKNSCPLSMILLGDGPLIESATASGQVLDLHPLLAARFNAAASFAAADGVTLYISSGFRTRDRQETLFAEAVKKYGNETEAAKWVLPPQNSHHPQGLAIDVNYPGDRPGAFWLEKNGSRFGLCRVYANEWWHFEGVIAPGERCPRLAPNALVDFKAP
jgi:zinc D-Ala-D-Ala carboxypeptidase